jgi:GGDEF domain-containing protein
VLGSLGLLHPSIGEARLDEEIERARYADSPLSILRINATLTRDLAGPDRDRALRAVGRTFESLLHVIHVPFAYSDRDLVAILPEMGADDASELAERVRLGAAEATVIVGRDRMRRRFGELGTVRFGVATFRIDGHSAGTLLAAAVPPVGICRGRDWDTRLGRVAELMARHRLMPHALRVAGYRPTPSSSNPIWRGGADRTPVTIDRSKETTPAG